MTTAKRTSKVALITGAAKRIGADLARTLHQAGFNILIHYSGSGTAAEALCDELEQQRADSCEMICADLSDLNALEQLAQQALNRWGRIDVLINNASRFYPTELESVTLVDWDDLINTNLRAPLFLCRALADPLRQHQGTILNMVDIYAERPLKGYPLYSVSKAGMAMLTKSLAAELGPEVRVNGIAPGAILWPENDAELKAEAKERLLQNTALKMLGGTEDICKTALFLIEQAPYITGQVISVDGGRTLNQ